MAIRHQQPPAESLSELKDAAARLHPAHGEIAGMLLRAAQNPMESLPHSVYTAGLDAMAGADGLSKAERAGWWYLTHSLGRNYAIEVQHDESGEIHRFAGAHRSPFIEELRQLLADPELGRRLGGADYTPAVLRVHAMSIFALWLQPQKGDDSLLIAIPPTPSALRPWPTVYTAQQFQDALRNEAQRLLTLDNSPVANRPIL